MFQHTQAVHDGVIGRDRGIHDFKYALLETFRDNLTRQVDEGRRQMVMEDLQSKNKVSVLNSKLDFIQPFKTHLRVHSGNINIAPGTKDPKTVRFKEDRQHEDQRQKTTNGLKRKIDNDDEHVEAAMKKKRIENLYDTCELKLYSKVQRSSTPVPSSSEFGAAQLNSKKRKYDDTEHGSAWLIIIQ